MRYRLKGASNEKRVARKKKWLTYLFAVTLLNWKLFEGAVAPEIPKHNSPSKFLSLVQYTTINTCSIVSSPLRNSVFSDSISIQRYRDTGQNGL